MTSTLRLPRPVRLAVWANAWSQGSLSLDEAVEGARAADPPHLLVAGGDHEALIVGFRRIFERGDALAVLPTPGFLLGLAGPPSFNKAALDAGGAVISGETGLIPDVSEDAVRWHEYEAVPSQHHETLREANFGLRQALVETATALAEAELAAAREALLDDLLAAQNPQPLQLPRSFDDQDERVVATALQCLRLTGAALADHAVDHSASAAHLRTSTLRSLDQAARRVLVAASAHRPRR